MPIIDPDIALSTRQEAFCRHYAASGNAADAAKTGRLFRTLRPPDRMRACWSGPYVIERLRRIRLSWKRTERDEARIVLARLEQAWDAATHEEAARRLAAAVEERARLPVSFGPFDDPPPANDLPPADDPPGEAYEHCPWAPTTRTATRTGPTTTGPTAPSIAGSTSAATTTMKSTTPGRRRNAKSAGGTASNANEERAGEDFGFDDDDDDFDDDDFDDDDDRDDGWTGDGGFGGGEDGPEDGEFAPDHDIA